MVDVASSNQVKNDGFTPYYVGQTRVFVQSERFPTIDISKITMEVRFFENIGLPYMSAELIIVDSSNASNAAPFIGQERVYLSVIDKDENVKISKEFICTGVSYGQKLNDGTSVYVVKLIEEHAMLSNSTRFRKVYDGKPEDICKQVCEEQLGVSVSTESSYQSNMRVVFPFTTNPLAAAIWMTGRCTTSNGSPFYLYSTMSDDNLQLKSLETLLKQSPINSEPYKFTRLTHKLVGGSEDYDTIAKQISGYTIGNNEDTLLAMSRNVYGGYFNYIDPYEYGSHEKRFDLPTPLDKLPKPNGTTDHNYDTNFKIGRPYHEGQNTYWSQLVTRKLFDDGIFSYNEEEDMERHKKKAESQALYNFMSQSPINIAVPGLEFGVENLGKMIDVFITKDIPIDEENVSRERIKDKKRSGKYLIYGIKHTIFKNRWISTLTLAKSDTLPSLSQEAGKVNQV